MSVLWNRAISQIWVGIPNIVVLVGDVAIYGGATLEDHLDVIRTVLLRLRTAGLMVDTLPFLGFDL